MIIGYTQGTFDMFHVGHLNLLKNAKKMCDYLVVGVNSDELVKKYKNKPPIIPLNERLEIVEAIKFVDCVIVTDTLDKKEAFDRVQFNYLFIGSDWKGNARWIETEKQMKMFGAEVVYLPYTEGISSSILRNKFGNTKAE